MGLVPKGEIWVVECKPSRANYQSNSRWQGYLERCDRFFWAVDTEFPTDLLPIETGLNTVVVNDTEITRMGPESKLVLTRRRKMVQKLAVDAALRLQTLHVPTPQLLTARAA